MSGFQQTVNIYNTPGFPGDLSFDGPLRSIEAILNSSGTPNLVGNAYTFTNNGNPDPSQNSPVAPTAQVGGSGAFAGILINRQAYANAGTTGNPLGASLAVPDNSLGELCTMGQLFVNLPGPANAGDLVTYDTVTGNLNSIPALAKFTGAIAAGGSAGVPDVLTVTLMTQGALGVGSIITGAGVETATILSLGTGLGGNGTYNLSTINQQTVSAVAMTAPTMAPPAFAVSSGYIVGTTFHVTTVTSGQLAIGQLVNATGILPNTVITAMAAGTDGGAGTYTVSQSQTLFSSGTPGAFTGNSEIIISRCTVGQWGASATGGVASITITQ